MTLNALGSLCEKFTWNSRCDNTKISCCNKTTTIYVGNTMNTTFYADFSQPILEQAMKALDISPSPIEVSKVKTLANLVLKDFDIAHIRAGMCEKVRQLTKKLNMQNEESGNGQSKMMLAAVLSKIDTAMKYKSGTPLTKNEFGELKKQAETVQKYYQAAIYLRMVIANFECDLSKIDEPCLKNAIPYLRKKMVSMSKNELTSTENSFWELSKYIQKTLLKACTKLKDPALVTIQGNPDLISILSQPKRHRTPSDENALPKVFQDSAKRGHRPGRSDDEKTDFLESPRLGIDSSRAGERDSCLNLVKTDSPKTEIDPLKEKGGGL